MPDSRTLVTHFLSIIEMNIFSCFFQEINLLPRYLVSTPGAVWEKLGMPPALILMGNTHVYMHTCIDFPCVNTGCNSCLAMEQRRLQDAT